VTLVRPQATPEQMREHTVHALAEAAAGRLRPVIGQRFPLERAADAHAAIESRSTIGKTLLQT
jgi:NADPH:quinone reductase